MAYKSTNITLEYPSSRLGGNNIVWAEGIPVKYKHTNGSTTYRTGTLYLGLSFGLQADITVPDWYQTGYGQLMAYFVPQPGDNVASISASTANTWIRFSSGSHTGSLTSIGTFILQPDFASKYSVYTLARLYDIVSPAVIGYWAVGRNYNKIGVGDTWIGNKVSRSDYVSINFTYMDSVNGHTTTESVYFSNAYSVSGLKRRVSYDKNRWVGNITTTGMPETNPQYATVERYVYVNDFIPSQSGVSYRRNCDGRDYLATFEYWTTEDFRRTDVRDIPREYRWYYFDQYTPSDREHVLYAMCSYPYAKIVYYGNGATGGDQQTEKPMVQNTAYALPSRTGYEKTGNTFNGWWTAPTGGVRITSLPNGVHSEEHGVYSVYAQWTPNTYTVTFNKQGGTGGTNSVDITYGVTDPMPTIVAPTRTGYLFLGYYTKPNGKGTRRITDALNWVSTPNTAITENTTLYAYWVDVRTTLSYEVNYHKGVADLGSIPGTQRKYDSIPLTLAGNSGNLRKYSRAVTTNPFVVAFNYGKSDVVGPTAGRTTRTVTTSYTMDGWSTTSEGTRTYPINGTYTGNAPIDLYPHFTPTETVTENKTVTLPNIQYTPSATDCYVTTIEGWYTAATGGTKVGNPGATYTPTANTTLYARITTVQKTALIKYIYGVTTVTRTLNPVCDFLIESAETVGITELNKLFKGWTTTNGSTTVNYSPGTVFRVNCPTTSGTTVLTLYPVWEDAPPEDVYVWQDPAGTEPRITFELSSNNTSRTIRLP